MLRVTPPDEADVWPWAYASLAMNSVIPQSAQDAKPAKPRRVSISPVSLLCPARLRPDVVGERTPVARALARRRVEKAEPRSRARDAPAQECVERGGQAERVEDQVRVDRDHAGARDGERGAERDERPEHLVVAVHRLGEAEPEHER